MLKYYERPSNFVNLIFFSLLVITLSIQFNRYFLVLIKLLTTSTVTGCEKFKPCSSTQSPDGGKTTAIVMRPEATDLSVNVPELLLAYWNNSFSQFNSFQATYNVK